METIEISEKERLRIYKEAIEILNNSNGEDAPQGNGLCILLRSIYFGYTCWQDYFNLGGWQYPQTPDYFPEIKPLVIKLDDVHRGKHKMRIRGLTKIVHNMESNLTKISQTIKS